MKLYIKYMVSLRCRLLAKKELSRLNFTILELKLGMIEIKEDMSTDQRTELQKILIKSGMHLLDEKRGSQIERLQKHVMESIHIRDPQNLTPQILADETGQECKEMETMFSEIKGISLEQFINIHKVEKAKEYLLYENMTMEEIAQKLHFEDVAIMKHQFSKFTGLKPMFFIRLKKKREDSLQETKKDKPPKQTH